MYRSWKEFLVYVFFFFFFYVFVQDEFQKDEWNQIVRTLKISEKFGNEKYEIFRVSKFKLRAKIYKKKKKKDKTWTLAIEFL